ncbi:MAG: type II secretion system F family protein [Candidatus Gracilibacteria bacterium]|nr:type II secretion system F family protein [Candidatus Gracilibacteria bacterium]
MSDILILEEDKNHPGAESQNQKATKSYNSLSGENGNLMDKINLFLLNMQNVKTKEKVLFYRLLATMTNAGMTVLKSLIVIEKQEKNPALKQILGRFCQELRDGKNLSECLALYPSSFSEAEIGIISSGEKTGKLNESLSELSSQIEKVESISGKLKSAMMYPMFIMIIVVGVIGVMMVVVVPRLLEIFGEDQAGLPASTQLLITISDIFSNYWMAMIGGFFLFVIAVKVWKKTPNGRYIFDNIMLKVPVFGQINKKLTLSKFARVFSGLLGSGVSIVECLKITSVAVGNEVYKQRLLLLGNDVQQGIKIWESLDGDKLFPDMMVQMIQVGEQTAKLDQTVIKVADFYDEQVDNTISIINKLLEPFIIVFLAVVVGFIAVAIMQPIMTMADTVTQ